MKFLVVLVLVGLVAAGEEDNARKAAALRVLTMEASEMTKCSSDADCKPEKPKCDDMMKLCKPAGSPSFELIKGDCTDHAGCSPIHRCKSNKCHFSGPKACDQSTDCLQGVEGHTYDCLESAKSAPGKRCWKKCTADADCHDRMPDEVKSKIGCCQGHCQKKAAC